MTTRLCTHRRRRRSVASERSSSGCAMTFPGRGLLTNSDVDEPKEWAPADELCHIPTRTASTRAFKLLPNGYPEDSTRASKPYSNPRLPVNFAFAAVEFCFVSCSIKDYSQHRSLRITEKFKIHVIPTCKDLVSSGSVALRPSQFHLNHLLHGQ